MGNQGKEELEAKPEQIKYANMLFIGAWVGILLLICTYILYISGIIPPHVEIEVVTQNWHVGLHEFIEKTDAPVGWGWFSLLGKGDYLNFAGLVILASMTIICYIFLVPAYVRKKDWAYTIICIVEIIILGLAASNILGGGGH